MPVNKKRIVNKRKVVESSSDSSSSSSSESENESSSVCSTDESENWTEDDSSYCPSSEMESESSSKKHAAKKKLFDENVLTSLLNAVKSELNKKNKNNKKTKRDQKVKKHKKRRIVESEDDEDNDDDEEELSVSVDDESSSSETEDDLNNTQAISVVYTIDGFNDAVGDYYGAEEDAEILEEDENEECNSDDEKMFIGENYETVVIPEPLKKNNKGSSKKQHRNDKSKNAIAEKQEENEMTPDIAEKYRNLMDLKRTLVDQINKNPSNRQLRKALATCNEDVKKLIRKSRHNNTKEYHKLVHNELNQTNELEYFKKQLSNSEQRSIMRELKSINETIYSNKPQRLALLQSSMENKYKAIAMQRINKLMAMDNTDNEFHKLKHWVDNFMRIPFGIYRNLSVSLKDGADVCNQFMVDAKTQLDQCVYGLNDAKTQIMQMIGQWVVNPSSVGTAIAIHGPPGTGKTSIVKDGISKILGREFAFVALGGCGDGSFLEGHSYTYEGSLWGKIVQILMDSKCMNPVIYFDELDKVSDTARGQEIIGILTHLTDVSQNSEFHDKFFSDVSFDLSKCLFIFSYNDESLVNPILKDRMYRIQTKGYDTKEKITIARNYLLPRIREQVCFGEEEVVIPDDTLKYIIGAEHLCKSESGVRNLKRCLEIIYTKLNLFRLVKPGSAVINVEEDYKGLDIKWPFVVNRKEVDIFIKNKEPLNPTLLSMYL